MGRTTRAEQHLSRKLKTERQRRDWSQADVAKALSANGFQMYPTTIAKIEAGDRAVKIEEAVALADLFDLTLDVLTGRNYESAGQAAEMRSVTATAQELVPKLTAIGDQIDEADAYLADQRNHQLFESCMSGDTAFEDVPLEDWRALLMVDSLRSARGGVNAAIFGLAEVIATRSIGRKSLPKDPYRIGRALDQYYGGMSTQLIDELKNLADKWKAVDGDTTT